MTSLAMAPLKNPSSIMTGSVSLTDDTLTALGLHISYETEPRYLVYALGIDEPFLQDYWHIPPLPEWAPRIAHRKARIIQPPPGFTVPPVAVQAWQQAQELYYAHGLTLADAQLIILSDWD